MVKFSRNEADSIIVSAQATSTTVRMKLDAGDIKAAVDEFMVNVQRYNIVMNDDSLHGWREVHWRRCKTAFTALSYAKQALLDAQQIPVVQKKKIERIPITIPPATGKGVREKIFSQLAAIITVEAVTTAVKNIISLWKEFDGPAEVFIATYPSASKHIHAAHAEYLQKGQELIRILTNPDVADVRTELESTVKKAIANLNELGALLDALFQALPLDTVKKRQFGKMRIQVQTASQNELDRLAA